MTTSLARTLRLALSGALTLTLSGTALITSATGAHATSAPTPYECGSDGVYGDHGALVTWDTDAPDKIYVGDPAVQVTATGVAQLDNNFTRHLYWNRVARSGSGTSALTGAVGSTARTMTLSSTIDNIPSGGTTVMNMSGPLGTIEAPTSPGTLPISFGDFTSTLTLKNGVNSNIAGGFTCTTWVTEEFVDTIQVVSRSATTLSVSPVTEGQSARVVATVSVTGGTPAGVVTFSAGGESVYAEVINGEATADLPPLPAGSYPVTAAFAPDDTELYEASSAQKLLKVDAIQATTTTLELGQTTTVEGAPTTATATVATAGGEFPAGTMTFTAAGQDVTAQVVDGRASATLPNVEAGLHQVVATFTPTQSEIYAESQSAAIDWRVKVATSVGLSLKSTLIGYEQRAEATATVRASSGWTEGEVTFAVGGTETTVDLVDGIATARLPLLATGDYQVFATFVPVDPEATQQSTSSARSLTVTDQPTETTDSVPTLLSVGVSNQRPKFGQSVSVTAQVNDEARGNVVFSIGGRTIPTTVRDGVAVAALPRLQVGLHRLTARFVPADPAEFTAATAYESVRVTKAGTITSAPSVRTTASKKSKVRTLRVTSTVSSPQKVRPVGRAVVTLRKGATTLRKTVWLRAGRSTAGFAKVAPGRYTVTVRYLGSKNFAPSAKVRKVVVR